MVVLEELSCDIWDKNYIIMQMSEYELTFWKFYRINLYQWEKLLCNSSVANLCVTIAKWALAATLLSADC